MEANQFKKSLEDLDPINFAFIMATGIVSISLHINGWIRLGNLFLAIGTVGYIGLILLFAARFYLVPKIAFHKMKDIQELFKYLSFSAGSDALAAHFSMLGNTVVAFILGFIGAISTIFLIYAIFCMLFFHAKESIQVVCPYWLLMAIASNSVGMVISDLWNQEAITNETIMIIASCFWSFGIMVYIFFMSLNFYRMFFFPFKGGDLNPAFWTCLGGAAIAVVDGCNLVLVNNAPQFLEQIKPFISGISLLLWGWGTAFLPILILMWAWKYFYFKVPLENDPSMWSVVFPLGMYSASIVYLSNALQMHLLDWWRPIFLAIAVLAWLAVGFVTKFNPFAKQMLREPEA